MYHEYKRAQHEVMTKVKDVGSTFAKGSEKLSGRKMHVFETYRLEDADIAIVILNSAAGTTKRRNRRIQGQGRQARTSDHSRPFPYTEIADAPNLPRLVCVMDRQIIRRLWAALHGSEFRALSGRQEADNDQQDIRPWREGTICRLLAAQVLTELNEDRRERQ